MCIFSLCAVEHLISIGADVNVRWTQDGTNDLGFLTTSITTPQMSRFVRLSINIVQNSLASNTLAKGAWFGGQLSLLHLAVGSLLIQYTTWSFLLLNTYTRQLQRPSNFTLCMPNTCMRVC
jgi:hypothetical protein